MENFKGLKYFTPTSDNWGDASKIDAKLLRYLDQLREELNTPIVVTNAYRPADTASQHSVGKAVDIVFPQWRKGLMELFLVAERFPFTGIGIYPDWSHNHSVIGGLHLDVRDLKGTDKSARWIGSRDPSTKKNVYIAFNIENLRAMSIL